MRGTDVSDMKRTYRTATEDTFPDELEVKLVKEFPLRYGENPNQPGAAYRFLSSKLAKLLNIRMAKSGKGGLSATNTLDVTYAMEILKFFEEDAVSVMKHLIPSGFATGPDGQDRNYGNARDTDARSAFGCIAVFNRPVTKATADEIITSYVEGVAAPEFEEGAMGVLEQKKDLRTILFDNLDAMPKFVGDDTEGLYDLKVTPTGMVIAQKPYLSSIKGPEDLITDPYVLRKEIKHMVLRDPTKTEMRDLLTAWYINLGVRSNGIVFVKDGVTLAVGSGQQERVGAVEQALVKAYQKAMDREGIKYDALDGAADRHKLSKNPMEGSSMSSDAFFPADDSIRTAAGCGVSAVIQPGGSINDHLVIDAVNEHNMAMAYTLERCFKHF